MIIANINSILTNCSQSVTLTNFAPDHSSFTNTSFSYGISNLADPGWPSSSYQCNICRSTTEQSTQTVSATISASLAATTKAETTSKVSSSAFLTTASPSFPTSPTAASENSSSAYVSYRISAQGIAAIVVCTTLAIAATLLLLFCALRRRRKKLESYSGGISRRISRTTNEYILPGRDTYEPLISPSHSFSGERPQLTPPPRLSDRKLLPSLLRPLSRSENFVFSPPVKAAGHGSSGPYSTIESFGDAKNDVLVPQSPTAQAVNAKAFSSFPSPPFCSPTSNKMTPRLERMQTYAKPPGSPEPPSSPPYTQLKSPPPVSFTFPPRTSLDTTASRSPPPPIPTARKGHPRRGTARHPFSSSTSTSASSSGGVGRGGCGSPEDHSTMTNAVAGNGSPTRPRRPHEAPLEIPGLVSPLSTSASPPPNKSLPQPPPQPPPTMIGLAKTTGLPQQPPREGSISLHSLAEQHKRNRDSWGSWGDEEEEEEEGTTVTAAGRMFGVAFPPADEQKEGGG